MARTGFKKAKINEIDATTKKYKASGLKLFEKVVDEKFAPEYNNAELYGNDSLAESDNTFIKGTLTLTIVDDDDTLLSEIFGNTKANDGEVTQNINDTAPEYGYGHIIPKVVNGARKYKVEFFPRIKFTKVTSDNKTRGASVEFSTTSVEATVYPLSEAINGVAVDTWEKHQTFDTLAEAETYLDGLLTPPAGV